MTLADGWPGSSSASQSHCSRSVPAPAPRRRAPPGGGSTDAGNAASQGTADGGGGGGGGRRSPRRARCSLPEEVKAQFEFDVAAGGSGPNCSWLPVDFHPTFAGVEIAIQPYDQYSFDKLRGLATEAIDVSGVGEGAFFDGPANPYNLWFRQGDLMFALTAVASGPTPTVDEIHEKVITLGKTVLGRL